MRIVTVRRISQAFFLLLFLWFCVVSSFGPGWWQLRGWPVNWFLELDPLVAIGTMLTTGTLYAGLLWSLVVVVLTILLGRFFCGWVCPFGSMHQAVGYLGKRSDSFAQKASKNRYHRGQNIKYYILMVLLSAASGTLIARIARSIFQISTLFWILATGGAGIAALAVFRNKTRKGKAVSFFVFLLTGWTALGFFFSLDRMLGASLQIGLLDPIPMAYRSVNLILLPLSDAAYRVISANQRYYEGTWLIGLIFFGALLANLKSPRFYCRYICPLGALFAVFGRYALYRVGKRRDECIQCNLCEGNCEGACEPSGRIRLPECVLCMNCLSDCGHDLMTFQPVPSASGVTESLNLSRRGFMLTLVAGATSMPLLRLDGITARNWNPNLIRPPGALPESKFLARCIKCGQCMRICPTNIIQPADLEFGVEALWTPILNFRIGTSGCQLNCIACSYACPTAALRPLTLAEKLGRLEFSEIGPIKLGTAFIDRGRCLPWAMERPCIVCQENCPVSPKAIDVDEHFHTVARAAVRVVESGGRVIHVKGAFLPAGKFSTGDYYMSFSNGREEERTLIADNTDRTIMISSRNSFQTPPEPGTEAEIQLRLQRPQVDPERCIGCGVCQHECPVSGKPAIRVTAENESRNRQHFMLLKPRR